MLVVREIKISRAFPARSTSCAQMHLFYQTLPFSLSRDNELGRSQTRHNRQKTGTSVIAITNTIIVSIVPIFTKSMNLYRPGV